MPVLDSFSTPDRRFRYIFVFNGGYAMTIKMVIVIRKDLQMRKGKMIAQAAHAAQEAILDRSVSPPCLKNDPLIAQWLASDYRKIALQIDSEDELMQLFDQAKDLNINTHLVEDLGHTEFAGVKTRTAIALGPCPAEQVDQLTGHLKLL